MTHEIPSQFCPSCFTLLDAATDYTNTTDWVPEPGDITVCVECGAVLVYDPQMFVQLRKLSDVPIYIRAKVAHLVMLIHEKKEHSKRWI
jgi:hypothetical protein